MKKIINDPDALRRRDIDGHPRGPPGAAAGGRPRTGAPSCAPTRRSPGKVGIVTGGGSGHLPVFLGYVGDGLCTRRGGRQRLLLAVGRADARGHEGGRRRRRACCTSRQLRRRRHELRPRGRPGRARGHRDSRPCWWPTTSLGPPKEREHDRRGVAGIVFAYKVRRRRAPSAATTSTRSPAAAAGGGRARRTMGVGALADASCPRPASRPSSWPTARWRSGSASTASPGSTAARSRRPTRSPTGSIAALVERPAACAAGDRVAVLVNGLGATPLEELYVMYRRVHQLLAERGVEVERSTSASTPPAWRWPARRSRSCAGRRARPLLDAPASSPFFQQ